MFEYRNSAVTSFLGRLIQKNNFGGKMCRLGRMKIEKSGRRWRGGGNKSEKNLLIVVTFQDTELTFCSTKNFN